MITTICTIITAVCAILAALAALVQAVVVCVAATLALRQLKEATRARSLDGFLAISSELNQTEARESRKFIYMNGPLDPAQLSQGDRERVERVCVTFDRMGVLVEHGLIPDDVALSMYFDVVIRIWKCVRPFVEAERQKKSRLYMVYFEKLMERCEDHHHRVAPDVVLECYQQEEPQ